MIPKFPNPKNPRDPDYVPEIIGHCENCGNELSPDWELWKDKDSNLFCCEECAISYNGIHKIDDLF